jgi:hypothetical protein
MHAGLVEVRVLRSRQDRQGLEDHDAQRYLVS